MTTATTTTACASHSQLVATLVERAQQHLDGQRRAPNDCTHAFARVADIHAKKWRAKQQCDFVGGSKTVPTSILQHPRFVDASIAVCNASSEGVTCRCIAGPGGCGFSQGTKANATRASRLAAQLMRYLAAAPPAKGSAPLAFLVSRPLAPAESIDVERALHNLSITSPITFTTMGSAASGVMPVFRSFAAPSMCDCSADHACARGLRAQGCRPDEWACAPVPMPSGADESSFSSASTLRASPTSTPSPPALTARRPAAFFLGTIEGGPPSGTKPCRILAALEILAMHDSLGHHRPTHQYRAHLDTPTRDVDGTAWDSPGTGGARHRSFIRFGSRDVGACRQMVRTVALAVRRGTAHRFDPSSPAYPPPATCPRFFPPLLDLLSSNSHVAAPVALAATSAPKQPPASHEASGGNGSTWLEAVAEELCVPPILPAEAIRLGRAHVLQLELPGDAPFSAPSTYCGLADGAVRLLDPRIRTSSDFELAGLGPQELHDHHSSPPAHASGRASGQHEHEHPQHHGRALGASTQMVARPFPSDGAIRFASACELSVATSAAEHPIFDELGRANRGFAQRCLGTEAPRLLTEAIRAFGTARATCASVRDRDPLMELLVARASPDDEFMVRVDGG